MGVDNQIGASRTPSYLIGGQAPYGWKGTPAYNPLQVPVGADSFGEVALYERLDWTGGVGGGPTAQQQQLQNPPFLGIGSTAGRIPGTMGEATGTNTPHARRILRGYVRRYDVNPASTDNASDAAKSFMARLFFMWNPATIERKYLSYSDLSKFLNPAGQAGGVDQADIPLLSTTTVDFQLFFDRQEEVARFADHPGVLVDLAVFDLLARGGTPEGQITTKRLLDNDATGPGATGGSTDEPNATSLVYSPFTKLAVIFSPYLVYTGWLTSVNAVFEKFSHRMTPTRMTLYLSILINSFSNQDSLTNADHDAISAAATAGANRPGGPVSTGATTTVEKDRANIEECRAAMDWGMNWVAGAITPGGVMYSLDHRCDNPQLDNYTNPGAAIPTGFDCSSFVARCFCVRDLGSILGLDPCADTGTFEAAASGNPDVWYVLPFGDLYKRVGDSVVHQVAGELREGDCILRSGAKSAGHIVFVKEVIWPDKNVAPTYNVLHTGTPGTPVHITHYTLDFIMNGDPTSNPPSKPYTHLLRAQPVQMKQKAPEATNETGEPGTPGSGFEPGGPGDVG